MTIAVETIACANTIIDSWIGRNQQGRGFDFEKERRDMFKKLDELVDEMYAPRESIEIFKFFAAAAIDIPINNQEELVRDLIVDVQSWKNNYDKTLRSYPFAAAMAKSIFMVVKVIYNHEVDDEPVG
jgi:hypothetical protein